MTPAYEILSDTYRLGEDDFDCRVLREPQSKAVSWCGQDVPDIRSAVLVGDTARLDQVDFPANQLGWPIASARLWIALGRPGVPFAVTARTEQEGPEVLVGRFVVFHLAPVKGLMDLEASVWDEDSVFPGEVGLIRELRFTAGAALPAVFRLYEAPGRLFVSRRRRIRLLDVPCVGVRFAPVPAAG